MGGVRKYPALIAAVANIAGVLLAKYGFHVSATTLAVIATILVALAGAVVHSLVTPVVKKGTSGQWPTSPTRKKG